MAAPQELRFVVLRVCFLEKLPNFYVSTLQNWTSPIQTMQEKGKNDPLHVTLGCKLMKLWSMKVCQNHAHAQMEFLAISTLNIFKWLFPTKTKNVSFYSLSHVLSDSVINFIQA